MDTTLFVQARGFLQQVKSFEAWTPVISEKQLKETSASTLIYSKALKAEPSGAMSLTEQIK